MKNTRIVYKSEDRKPQVAPEFAELLPNLSDDQYTALEADILQNGCYSPVIVCKNLATGKPAGRRQSLVRTDTAELKIADEMQDDACGIGENMRIVDGHNQQQICEENNIPYTMAVFAFDDDLEAKQWMLDTQKGRRNLDKWELGKIALKLKPELKPICQPKVR